MVFDTLPEAVQLIYIENFNFMFKLALILLFLVVSILIVKNFKPKKSKYLFVSKIRLTYYVMAWLMIISFPFQLGFLSPRVPLSALLNPLITFYTVNFIVLGTILTLNIVWHGSGFITELFGNEGGFEGNNKVRADFNKYLK